uniref:Uncharacterized protein n=1 Tax=Avena sativa TaxID=4498 RepID=A0ACD5ZJJ1_AVESA
MDPRGQQDAMNMTRALEALSPYLNNPRQTVVRIQVYMALVAAMLFLQLILGSCRRRSGHWSVQGPLWLSYTLSFPLITYTIGQMVSSPVKNALYPLWAILIFSAVGCTNSITAYGLEDNKQWKRYIFELVQYYAYMGVIFRLLNQASRETYYNIGKTAQAYLAQQPVAITILFLAAVVFTTNFARVIAGWMVTNSTPSARLARYMRLLVAKHTRNHVNSENAPEPPNPKTLEGYKYLVRPIHKHDLIPAEGGRGTITIDEIWKMELDDSLLNTTGGGSHMKDVCLSFALSHLLKRRFFEMDCAEAALSQTREFVLDGLLSEEDAVNNYKREFHVIEVELGFLYDLFFTKYAALFHMEFSFLLMVLFKLISMAICWMFLLQEAPIIKTPDPVIEVGTTTIDVTITVIIMGSLCFIEVLQATLYLTSDWATISLACSRGQRIKTQKIIPSVIWFVRRFNLSRYWKSMIAGRKFDKFLDKLNLFGYWQKKMGQTSVIESCLRVDPYSVQPPMDFNYNGDLLMKLFLNSTRNFQGLIHSLVFSRKTSIVVSDLVKREIASCLKRYRDGDPLTNGEAALRRHGAFQNLSWTLNSRNQIQIMLIWHIATEYCNIASSDEAKESQSGPVEEESWQQVATTLSKYCAYLMSFVPDLLQENTTDTLYHFNTALLRAKRSLGGRKPSKKVLLDIIEGSENRKKDTVINISRGNNSNGTNIDDFIRGLKLGTKLENMEDDRRWQLLAEFWAETIIYIAPSDKATAHMEHLAQGGEFLTHVWALLTHAGILKRD